ncbi:divalent-cation tolerance protein CutA [Polyangium mundeleinium]|uniref:Divalent-cation tolerance protein CutA n=1 Tax=Polyangium mundeleinium TaxID=2995306 RepID=A0ABT5EKG7_9BACT|nr:divalent-cation tolerance protein CutA [Polyangium mundeleinium]MDC0742291.1 divalent-cation tolerance protein CutA [Polyangium mundeleinium]
MPSGHILVHITTRSAEEAEALGAAAVARRLAASAQVEPITTSHYRWRGAIHAHPEHRVTLFTRAALWDVIVAFVRANHSYELPQIVATPIALGLPEFLAWIDENTSTREHEGDEAQKARDDID